MSSSKLWLFVPLEADKTQSQGCLHTLGFHLMSSVNPFQRYHSEMTEITLVCEVVSAIPGNVSFFAEKKKVLHVRIQ